MKWQVEVENQAGGSGTQCHFESGDEGTLRLVASQTSARFNERASFGLPLLCATGSDPCPEGTTSIMTSIKCDKCNKYGKCNKYHKMASMARVTCPEIGSTGLAAPSPPPICPQPQSTRMKIFGSNRPSGGKASSLGDDTYEYHPHRSVRSPNRPA